MQEKETKLGHLAKPELTEFLIPVLCTGTKLVHIHAKDYASAAKEAVEKIERENPYSEDPLNDLKTLPLQPELMLAPEDRESWPYWGYGWYGTDGVDWRGYRTDKGISDIPGIAEESWPIAPYSDDKDAVPARSHAERLFEGLPASRDPFIKGAWNVTGPGHEAFLAFRANMAHYDIRTYGKPVHEEIDPSLVEEIVLDGHTMDCPGDFWSQHRISGTAGTFRDIARLVPAVRAALDSGMPIGELVKDEWLGRCAGIYFDLDRPDALVLIKGPGFYWFQSNGRHRTIAARLAGLGSIPAVIIGEISEKTGADGYIR